MLTLPHTTWQVIWLLGLVSSFAKEVHLTSPLPRWLVSSQSVRTGWGGSLCPPARSLPVAPFLSSLPHSVHHVHCPLPCLCLISPSCCCPQFCPLPWPSCCPLACPLPRGSRPGAARSSTAGSSSSRSGPCRGCMWLMCAQSRCWLLYGGGCVRGHASAWAESLPSLELSVSL